MQPATMISAVGIHIYNPTVNNTSSGAVSLEPEIKQEPNKEQQVDKSIYNVPQASVYGSNPASSNVAVPYKSVMLK
jgi:hypothetical protein